MSQIIVRRTRGDDWSIKGTIRESGEPLDLTGATYRCQIRGIASPGVEVFHELTVETTDAVAGKIEIKADRALTEEVIPGVYTFDVEVTKDGKKTTYGVGSTLVVRADATR